MRTLSHQVGVSCLPLWGGAVSIHVERRTFRRGDAPWSNIQLSPSVKSYPLLLVHQNLRETRKNSTPLLFNHIWWHLIGDPKKSMPPEPWFFQYSTEMVAPTEWQGKKHSIFKGTYWYTTWRYWTSSAWKLAYTVATNVSECWWCSLFKVYPQPTILFIWVS